MLTAYRYFSASRSNCDFALQRGRERVELLADGHRHGVLQFGAAHLHDVDDTRRPWRGTTLTSFSSSAISLSLRRMQRDLDRRRIRVVRRLRHVQVVVRLEELVLALLVAGQLEADVGEHLVGVHVRRRAGAALVPIDQELVVVLAVEHRLRAPSRSRPAFLLHRADVGVGARRRELHDRPRFDEAGIVIDRDAGDLEVLERPRRLHAVVGIGRNFFLPE